MAKRPRSTSPGCSPRSACASRASPVAGRWAVTSSIPTRCPSRAPSRGAATWTSRGAAHDGLRLAMPYLLDVLRLVLVFAFVLLNGFFVAAEFSLVTVRWTRVEELVQQGRFGSIF